jgi:cobalt-zinc-cadmium efflux system protein
VTDTGHGHQHAPDDGDTAARAHGHSHAAGHGHSHHIDAQQLADDPHSRRMLGWALVVCAAFLVVEVVGGVVANSLALLGDAAHMATDCAAYAIALWAARIARRPPNERSTFGYGRAEILAALVNGATLIAASGWIVFEATRRMFDPQPVEGRTVVLVALAGLLANLVIIVFLARADRSNLNVRAALLHGLTDALSSVGVLAAGIIVSLTGFTRADGIASYAIAALVLWGSWRLVREAADVLLNTAPAGLHADRVAGAMLEVDGVMEVHDLHVWSVHAGSPALSAHVRAASWVDRDLLLAELARQLASRFGIRHTTLQVAGDRATRPLDMVGLMSVAEAVEWATDHIAATHPGLSRSVILAATGVAAMGTPPSERVSPVALSTRTLRILGAGPDH